MSSSPYDHAEEVPFDPEDVATSVDEEYQEPALPPPGPGYEAVCTAVTFRKSKKGAPQIVLNLSDPEKQADARLYVTKVRGGWFPEGVFEAFGLPSPKADENGVVRVKFSQDDFVGKLVAASGVHEEYNNKLDFKFTDLRVPAAGPGARGFGY